MRDPGVLSVQYVWKKVCVSVCVRPSCFVCMSGKKCVCDPGVFSVGLVGGVCATLVFCLCLVDVCVCG